MEAPRVTRSQVIVHHAHRVATELEEDIGAPRAGTQSTEPEEFILQVEWIGDVISYAPGDNGNIPFAGVYVGHYVPLSDMDEGMIFQPDASWAAAGNELWTSYPVQMG
jgi:hypothetical protein